MSFLELNGKQWYCFPKYLKTLFTDEDVNFRVCKHTTSNPSFSLQLLPLFVMDVLGHVPGIPGIFVACIFSGALR